MENDFEIAPKFKRSDWLKLKKKLEGNMSDLANWEKAYEVLKSRIDARYLNPVYKIKELNEKSFSGEGFAIMMILCSLVEFLESLYLGKNYKHSNPGEFEYKKSSEIFKSFLANREPFKSKFPQSKIDEFYPNVRCGLLHEAATLKNWKIRVDTATLIKEDNGFVILNRNLFLDSIKEYLGKYRSELLKSKQRKEAFIRKFDHLAPIDS